MRFRFIPTEAPPARRPWRSSRKGRYFPGMPHAHILRERQLLAREVFPAFR